MEPGHAYRVGDQIAGGGGTTAVRPPSRDDAVGGNGSAAIDRAVRRSLPAMALTFTSRASIAPSRHRHDRSTISDKDMAWSLVEAVKSYLTGYERTVVFVELGCEESLLAIKHIFAAILSNRIALPQATLSKLTSWLSGYAGSPEEPQLHMMLAVIRLQQCDAI